MFFFITYVVYLGIQPAFLVRQELFDLRKKESKEEVESEEENVNKDVAEASVPEKEIPFSFRLSTMKPSTFLLKQLEK